ncbi:MAG: tetratricopeptide repeat protein [Planctomycetota bacterium]|nr:tetratricopeptide repeat protein [Planctomycetota bacterium]
MQLRQGDAVDALTVLKESVAIARELPPASRLELYDSFVDLAECEKLNGDSRGGIDHLREALELLSGTSTPQKFRKAELLGKLANALILAGRDAEAEPMFLEMIDAWRALLPADHPTVGYHQVAYSLWLRQRGRNAEAEPYLREAIRIYRATPHPSREYHLLALDGLFQILVKREESIDESIELFRQCMTEMGSLYGPDSLMLAQQFVGFSRLLEQRRKWAEMIPFVIEAIRIQRQRDTGDAVAKSVESQLDLLARATRRVVITPNLPPESYGLAQQGAEVLLQEPEYEKTARELLAMVRYRQGEFALALAALPERTPPAANADMEVAGRFIEYASFRALAQFRTGDRPAAVATLDSLTVVRDQWKTSIPTDASEILKEAQRTVTEVESPSH